jgi:CheY-like chemotaxis protein
MWSNTPGRRGVDVTVRCDPRAVTIDVVDDRLGSSLVTGHGHGLVGMRERVALFGGSLTVGPRAGGGFEVHARLPRDDVADDQDLVREGLRMMLSAESDVDVVGEAATGTEALRVCRDRDPDVVLMDVRMPGLDGIEATARLVGSGSRARVLILTTFDLDEYVYRAMRPGRAGSC